ncbi:MAG TPA: CHAD domain-containing protein [Polyangiaceae bacterium]
MAFRLDRNRSVAGAVPRIVRKQAAKAARGLDPKAPGAEGIHVARTSLKRLRGLLRLLKPELGSHYREEERRLEKVQRALGPIRDAQVLVETFDEHFRPKRGKKSERGNGKRGSTPNASGSGLDAIRVALEARALSERFAADVPERIAVARAEFEKLRRRAERFVPRRGKRAGGFRAIERGLESTYRRARAGRDAAYERPSSSAFHAFRKAVKYHGHHLKLLADVQPDELGPRLADSEELGDLLGKDHDLAVLAEALATLKSAFADETQYRAALDSIAREQAALRKRAKPLAERLFAESPAEFRRLMRELFRAWRDGPQ